MKLFTGSRPSLYASMPAERSASGIAKYNIVFLTSNDQWQCAQDLRVCNQLVLSIYTMLCCWRSIFPSMRVAETLTAHKSVLGCTASTVTLRTKASYFDSRHNRSRIVAGRNLARSKAAFLSLVDTTKSRLRSRNVWSHRNRFFSSPCIHCICRKV